MCLPKRTVRDSHGIGRLLRRRKLPHSRADRAETSPSPHCDLRIIPEQNDEAEAVHHAVLGGHHRRERRHRAVCPIRLAKHRGEIVCFTSSPSCIPSARTQRARASSTDSVITQLRRLGSASEPARSAPPSLDHVASTAADADPCIQRAVTAVNAGGVAGGVITAQRHFCKGVIVSITTSDRSTTSPVRAARPRWRYSDGKEPQAAIPPARSDSCAPLSCTYSSPMRPRSIPSASSGCFWIFSVSVILQIEHQANKARSRGPQSGVFDADKQRSGIKGVSFS